MEFICDLGMLAAKLGFRIAVAELWEPRISVGSRKVPLYALNIKQKGGPQLERLT